MTMPAATTLIRLSEPWCLAAAAAALVPPVLALRARRRGRHVGAFCVALQCLAVLAAALALCRPAVLWGDPAARPWLVLQDVSASVRSQPADLADWPAEIPRRQCDFAASVVPAGGSTDRQDTRVGPALRLAAAQAADLASVVIRTDGQFHDAGWAAAARALGFAGLPVLVVPMSSPPADARLSDLAVRRNADGRADLRAAVASNAMQRRTLTVLRTDRPDTPLLVRRLDMTAGESCTIRLADDPPADRAAVYRAVLSPDDAFPENDSAEVLLLPRTSRVAVVSTDGQVPRTWVPTDMVADPVPPAAAPAEAAGWADYAAVVLLDSTGELFDRPRRQALADFVLGGGGLVLIGAGPHQSPADADDPLNRIAALVPNPYQRRPLKVVVVLDASGSMAEQADGPGGRKEVKFDQASQAVLSLRSHLTAGDALTVITFSDAPREIFDGGEGPIDFAALRAALSRVSPGGPTRVRPALEMAAARPVAPPREGLVLLASDLLTETFDPGDLARRFRDRKLSLAIVATESAEQRPSSPPPLEALAGMLGSPMVRRDSLTGLAEVFAGFLRRARGEAIRRGSFRVEGGEETFPGGPPPLLEAYILAAANEAHVALRVGADPLLGQRLAGLGRSATLAVPLGPNDNAEWQRSAYLADLLASQVRWALRATDDPRFAARFDRRNDSLRLTIEARDADGPMNRLRLTARLTCQGEEARDVPLEQTAPGTYEADLGAPEGPAAAAVTDDAGRTVWHGALGVEGKPETAAIGPHEANLLRLAECAGGRIVPASSLPAWLRRRAAEAYREIWPHLLALAAAAMLLEWAVSRVRRRGQSGV